MKNVNETQENVSVFDKMAQIHLLFSIHITPLHN